MGRRLAWAAWVLLLLFVPSLHSTRGTAEAFVRPPPLPQAKQRVETCTPTSRSSSSRSRGGTSIGRSSRPRVFLSSIDSSTSASTTTLEPTTAPSPSTSSSSSSSSSNAHDLAEQAVAHIAVELRQGIKKKAGAVSVAMLQQLEASLRLGSLLVPPSTPPSQPPADTTTTTTTKDTKKKRTGLRQPRASTRKLLVAVIRDFARFNLDPGPSFWHALTPWLSPPTITLSTSELASLTLSLATLDVPQGSETLLDAVLHAVCTHKKPPPNLFSIADGKQLCKALTLLQRPGGTFRAGPAPSMSWLLALLQARDKAEEAAAAAAAATGRSSSSSSSSGTRLVRRPAPLLPSPEPVRRQTALTSSVLHRRVVDLLTPLGFACESEVAHAGLNLDLVLYPPSLPPSSSTTTASSSSSSSSSPSLPPLLPLIIEIDGPQHFIHGDPTRPTGATAARRRLLRSQHDEWAGLVAITYLDEDEGGREGGVGKQGRQGPAARLLGVVERKVREEGGVELAIYRVAAAGSVVTAGAITAVVADSGEGGEEDEQNVKWELAKCLFLASSPENLLEILRDERNKERMDATHWATALARMSRFVKHHHHQHHRRQQSSSSSSSSSASSGSSGSSSDNNDASSSSSSSTTGKRRSNTKGSSSSSSSSKKERRRWYMSPEGVLRDAAHARELLQQSTFPALALVLEALSEYYDHEEEEEEKAGEEGEEEGKEGVSDALELAHVAVARAKALQQEEEEEQQQQQQQQQQQHEEREGNLMTSSSLVSFLRALAKLGYRSSSSLPVSPTLLQSMTRQGQLDSAALASVLDSLAIISLQPSFPRPTSSSLSSSSSLPDGVSACVATLLRSGESQLHLLRPRDLVSFVRAMALFSEACRLCPPSTSSSSSSFSSSSSSAATTSTAAAAAAVAAANDERLIAAIVEAAGRAHICQSLSLADLALLTYKEPAEGDGDGGIINQRERRKAPQWPLVGEVRRRLRALSPSALVLFMQEDMAAGGAVTATVAATSTVRRKAKANRTEMSRLQPRPTRAFLVMLTNELYKQRAALTVREKMAASACLRGWGDTYDPGPRFWQRFV